MTAQYYIDMKKFSLEEFRNKLKAGEALPGRKILTEKISERFEILDSMGISNLKELMDALKTKAKVETFSQDSGLLLEYLVILRREVNSYMPKPVNLKSIPGADPEHIERLTSAGIRNTKQLFERTSSRNDRAELSRLVDVPGDDLLELVILSDLARIGGVGPVFARIILDAGFASLEKFASASADDVFERVIAVNNEKRYTAIMPNLKDVALCINIAKGLPKVIEY